VAALKSKGSVSTILLKSPENVRPVSLRQISTSALEIIEYLSNNNVTKAIVEIFKPLDDNEGMSSPRVILIDGAPGIGKTYLCKEIAYQWSQGKILTEKRFLFLLRAYEQRIQSLKEVKDLIKYCCHLECEATINDIYKHIKETEGATLVVLLDGYNELPIELPQDSLVFQLISRQRLRKCEIVITSRSFTYGSVCQFADCRKEIIGFTNNDRQEYIQRALSNKPDDIAQLKQYLDSHPTVSNMCYVPLNMTILLFLFTMNNLPQSRTELYEKFVDLTIKLHIEKDENMLQRKDSCIDFLKQKLGKFSYDTLRKGNMAFSLEEVKIVYPEITENCVTFPGFGLVQATQHFTTNGKTLSFNFIHSSIQDFLAAYYIQSLNDDKQLNFFRDTFWNERYLNTWIIYVGLTKGQTFSFKHFLSGNQFSLTSKLFKDFHISPKILQDKIKCLYLFQCFKEAKDKTMCKIVCESMENKTIDLNKSPLSPNNVITLCFFLTYSYLKKWEKLDLSNCNIQDFGLRNLWRALCSNGKSKVCINIMNLSGNQLSEICAGALTDMVKSCRTEELHISNNELGDEGAKSFVTSLSDDTSLKVLVMDGNNISENVAEYIEQSFASMNIVGTCHLYVKDVSRNRIVEAIGVYSSKCNLTKFSMCNCPVDAMHLEDILNLLVKNIGLVSLHFSHIGLQKPMVNFFATRLSLLKSLSDFSLVEPSLCETAVDDLISSLSVSNIVKLVIISDIKVHVRQSTYLEIVKLNTMLLKTPNFFSKDEQSVDNFKATVRVSPLLQVIDVSHNKLGSIEMKEFAKGIKDIQKLKSLILSRNDVDDVAAEAIAKSLENKTCLEVLDMGENKISSKGALAISKSLNENTMLKVLDLHNNFIKHDAAPALSSMLDNKTNLFEVRISRNGLEANGISDIADALQYINSLKVLDVSYNNIQARASNDIAAILKSNTSLEILNVSHNKLENLGCNILCKALQKHHHNLKVFNISSNGVNSITVARELASALKDKQKLEVVNVSQNKFEVSLVAIVASMKSTKFLKELTLRESGTVDHKAVIEICQVINQNPSLEVLDLGCTMLQTSGADKIFQALSRNTTLKFLNVSYNNIEDSAIKQLASSSLAYYPTLSVLLLHNNPLSDSAIKEVVFKQLLNAPRLKKIRVPNISNARIKADIDQKVKTINRNRSDCDKLIFSNFG